MHIGFGQNTVSSLYGHQKGDHMKTIGFSHKKHKANESQEKMTVTSGKDVCRKIGHSDEVDGENQENTYIHDSFALDASYANYIRETVPKTVWSNDYLRELWDENAKYLKSIRESKNGYGFDDIGMGAAYAYSTMYQKIVEGYRNGTREVYVCDNPESGKRRLLSMDEELEKLNKGFEELIKWDKMVAKSQKQNAENKQKFQNTKLDESFDAFDINQACDYIQDSYLEFRSLYLEQYERTGGNIDIKSLFSSVLRSGNQDMHKYCEFLFEKIGFIDDERYANRYTEELIRKGKGKKAIYNLLIKKGIEQDLINENLSKYEKDDEFANALRIAEKLVKPESDYPIKKQKMQLIEKLLREGYGQDAINYAMSNITFTDNSQERLIKEYEKLQDKNIEKEKIIARLLAKGYECSDIKRILK